jgi:membrane-associated protease RseP (regulator of RpoE activity)
MSAREPELGSFPPPSRPAPVPMEREDADPEPRFNWRTNAILFVLTVLSVFWVGQFWTAEPGMTALQQLASSWKFAVPLLAILLAHEFGHYFAARYHRVPASLPYFIPVPFIGLFGTLGAVIAMPDRIRSRNALLDIGASGPLAGLVVALPVLFWGVAESKVLPHAAPYDQEGQSLLYFAVKWLVHGSIPEGHDVFLHPAAFAGWGGLFLTMINLLPFGQLDGGHISYALFGERQNRAAPWIRLALVPLFLYVLATNLVPALRSGEEGATVLAIGNSLFWLIWYALLGVLARFSGQAHPPCEPGELSPWRRGIAWFCLILFVVLFMPRPIERVM